VVKGVEVFYQAPFTFLPDPYDGFGAIANFTYTAGHQSGPGTGFVANDGTTYPMQINGLSSYSYSTTVYYEKYDFNIRLSYNWRSKFPATDANYYNTNMRMWQQARGMLDLTIGYNILDNLEARWDVTNLLASDEYQFLANAVPGPTQYGGRYSGTGVDQRHVFYDWSHGRNYVFSLRGHL